MSTSSRWRKESLLRLYSLGPKARLERRPPHYGGFSVVRTPTSSGGPDAIDESWRCGSEPRPWTILQALRKDAENQSAAPQMWLVHCDLTQARELCGLRRVSQTPGNWICIDCVPLRSCTPPLPSTVPTLVGQPIGAPRLSGTSAPKKRCLQCGKVVRYSPNPLVCIGCWRTCHKSCSNMSRGEQSMHISNGSWHCENCSTSANNKGVDSGDRRQAAPSRKTDVSRRGCLKILQWNANGIRTKMVELEYQIRKFNLDIIMIQETKLRALDKNPAIKGYSTVRKDRGVGSGWGLLFFIKEDIPFTTIGNTPTGHRPVPRILYWRFNRLN